MSKWSAWPAEPIKDLSEIRRRHARDESRSSLWDNNPYVMHRDREWLLDRVSQLQAALRFYADESRYKPTSWHMCGHSTGQAILIDGGSRARKTLEAKP